LEKLGFPWILSTESSLFNGSRRIFAEPIFMALYPPTFAALRHERARLERPRRRIYASSKLSYISDFLQEIVADLIALAIDPRLVGVALIASSHYRACPGQAGHNDKRQIVAPTLPAREHTTRLRP
jgi:hypothetical protein